jgi:hypothetical protein
MATASSCTHTCSGCATGEFCYVSSLSNQLAAFCAHTCLDDRDCATGEKCARLFNEPSQPAVCVSSTVPATCATNPSPTFHCDFTPAACRDSQTLAVGFTQVSNQLCGWEFIHCDNGCVPSTTGGPAACG